MSKALGGVARRLSKWNREVVGELSARLKATNCELERWRRRGLSDEKVREENRLRKEVAHLEELIHIKWRQRAHVWWLKEWGRNTKYLHQCATARKKNNKIKELRKEDGSVVTGGPELTNYVCSFFQELFTTKPSTRLAELAEKVQPRVTPLMNGCLMQEFMKEEIKAALDHIGNLKAPGPDGMPSLVYKKHWEMM